MNDIEKLTKNYHSGIKKLDGLNENNTFNNNKTNHKNNFKFKQSNDDYGLDDKVTISNRRWAFVFTGPDTTNRELNWELF